METLLHIMKDLAMKKRILIARAGRKGRNVTRLLVHTQENIDRTCGAANYRDNWPRRRYLAPVKEWQPLQNGHPRQGCFTGVMEHLARLEKEKRTAHMSNTRTHLYNNSLQ